MSLTLEAQPLPMQRTAEGVVRIGGTRVTLDSVIAAYRRGATAEEIVQAFDTLLLEDVYAVLSYYLRHREQVDVYLQERAAEAEDVRAENERRFPPDGVRDRLLARKDSQSGPSC
jgi:uncharacterized protein (DUF433 family)